MPATVYHHIKQVHAAVNVNETDILALQIDVNVMHNGTPITFQRYLTS